MEIKPREAVVSRSALIAKLKAVVVVEGLRCTEACKNEECAFGVGVAG